MAKGNANQGPRIANRRAMHDYFISAKIECGIALLGSEVKALREGRAQLTAAFARVEGRRLVLHGAQIEPYSKAAIAYNHDPTRDRYLLVHRREMRKLEEELTQKGTTLIPLAIYFKDGRAKVELGVARGKQQYDKRQTIKKKEADRDLRRITMRRG